MRAPTVEEVAVRELAEELGQGVPAFGALMQIAASEWRHWLRAENMPDGSEFTIGPCAAMVVPCGCRTSRANSCDWCCGTGVVTERVRRAQRESR